MSRTRILCSHMAPLPATGGASLDQGCGVLWASGNLGLGSTWKCTFGISGLALFQGVVEFSLCLLFAKLVSYTFLFWLPLYITSVGECLRPEAQALGSVQTL